MICMVSDGPDFKNVLLKDRSHAYASFNSLKMFINSLRFLYNVFWWYSLLSSLPRAPRFTSSFSLPLYLVSSFLNSPCPKFLFFFFKEDYVTADTLVLWPSQSSHFLFWNVPQAVGVSIVLLMYKLGTGTLFSVVLCICTTCGFL